MTGDCHVRFCERLRGETPLCLLGERKEKRDKREYQVVSSKTQDCTKYKVPSTKKIVPSTKYLSAARQASSKYQDARLYEVPCGRLARKKMRAKTQDAAGTCLPAVVGINPYFFPQSSLTFTLGCCFAMSSSLAQGRR